MNALNLASSLGVAGGFGNKTTFKIDETKKVDSGFQTALDKAKEATNDRNLKTNESHKKVNDKTKKELQKNQEKPQTNEKSKVEKKENKTDEVKEKVNVEKDKEVNDDDKVTEEEVIEKLTEKLEMTVEEIQELLGSLNMKISDLTDQEKNQQFINALLGVENSVDLLKKPEAIDQLKLIHEAINELEEEITSLSEETLMDGIEQEEFDFEEILNSNDFLSGDENEEGNLETENQSSPNNGFEFVNGNIGSMDMIDKINGEGNVIENSHSNVNVPREVIVNQIVENIQLTTLEDGAEMSIQLRPEHLGRLSFNVASRDGIVTAQFFAESQQVKEAIEANLANLKVVLEEQGINVEDIEVSVVTNEYFEQQQDQQQSSYKQNKQKRRIIRSVDSVDEEIEEVVENSINEDGRIDFSA